MHYYIDGYNMLFRILHAGDDLRTQREALVEDLKTKILLLNIDATLVFDSQYQPDPGSYSRTENLEIVFTMGGETADEYILQELKELKAPSEHTIITSDKKLAWLCRRRLANTESVEDFLSWMNKRYKNRLRQQREKTIAKSEPPKEAESTRLILRPLLPLPEQPVEKDKIPVPAKPSVEESFDFYLKTFEAGIVQEVEKPSKKRKLIVKPPPKPVDPEEAHISDMERWEREFQRRAKEQQKESDF